MYECARDQKGEFLNSLFRSVAIGNQLKVHTQKRDMSRMTVDLLCKCTGQTRRKRDETKEQFLGRVTHLYCAEKEIRRVVSGGVCLDRFRLHTKTDRP